MLLAPAAAEPVGCGKAQQRLPLRPIPLLSALAALAAQLIREVSRALMAEQVLPSVSLQLAAAAAALSLRRIRAPAETVGLVAAAVRLAKMSPMMLAEPQFPVRATMVGLVSIARRCLSVRAAVAAALVLVE